MKPLYKTGKIFSRLMLVATVGLTCMLSSCEDYLNIKPKGIYIPETLADYEALFNNTSATTTAHSYYGYFHWYILGETYQGKAWLGYYPDNDYSKIYTLYTDYDRSTILSSYEITAAYRGVAVANQIIDGCNSVEGCDEDERQSLVSSARVVRALQLFRLAQSYAEAYNPATATQKYAVPLVLSSSATAEIIQPTLADFYQFLISELQSAVDCISLPAHGNTVLIPGKGAAYAALARVKLAMWDYAGALDAAEKALGYNDNLIDWVGFYNDNYESYFKNYVRGIKPLVEKT